MKRRGRPTSTTGGHGTRTWAPVKTPQLVYLHGDLWDIVDSNQQDGDKAKGAVAVDAFPGLGKTTAVLAFAREFHRREIAEHGAFTAQGHERWPVCRVGLTGNTGMKDLNRVGPAPLPRRPPPTDPAGPDPESITVARLHEAVPTRRLLHRPGRPEAQHHHSARHLPAVPTPGRLEPSPVPAHPAHRHPHRAMAHLVRTRPSAAPGHRRPRGNEPGHCAPRLPQERRPVRPPGSFRRRL